VTDEREERRACARRGRAVTYWAQRRPDADAIRSPTGTRTFAELDANADRLVAALRARGVGPGDAIAFMATNRVELAEIWAAALRGGLVLTPVNRHLTAEEARYILDDCCARAFLADASVDAAANAAPEVAVRLALGGAISGFEPYGDVIASVADDARADADSGDSLGFVMFYTSGTTGRPKGVERPAVPPDLRNLLGVRAGDVHLCTGPLYHAAPYAFAFPDTLSFGGTVVLMEHWDAEEALALIERHRVTHTHLVPTMFHRLLSLPDGVRACHDLSSLRVVLHGAAPCPVHVKRAVIEWLGPIVYEYYAATEGAGTVVDSATWLARPGTVGHPVDGYPYVGDSEARPLPAHEVGLVWLRAPEEGRFSYRGDPDKTAAAYRGDAFTLGDLGYQDDDGYLFLTDRSANVIISGGVNVYPAEVDAVLLTHPAVGDAATIGIDDDEWGEIVVAVVEPRAGTQITERLGEEIIEHCRSMLAHFKCPRRVELVDALPRSEAGKVSRHLVRERFRSVES
jgi:long-chain acyl-CoA synthetase